MPIARICRMGRFVALGLAALALDLARARGRRSRPDNSDLYIAVNEDGWGVELFQRVTPVFATIFTLRCQQSSDLYTATLFFGGTTAGGNAIWTGDLFVTQGSWFGAPFDRSKLALPKGRDDDVRAPVHRVGSAHFHRRRRHGNQADQSARVQIRQLRRHLPRCVQASSRRDAPIASDDGTFYFPAVFKVTQAANTLTIVADDAQRRILHVCRRLFAIRSVRSDTSAPLTCTNGINGAHLVFEMTVTPGDFRGRIARIG